MTTGSAISSLDPISYWLVFDADGSRKLNIRDALPAERKALRDATLEDKATTAKAESIKELASATRLPEHGLSTSIEIWNRMVEVGEDYQYGRFDKKNADKNARKIDSPPNGSESFELIWRKTPARACMTKPRAAPTAASI